MVEHVSRAEHPLVELVKADVPPAQSTRVERRSRGCEVQSTRVERRARGCLLGAWCGVVGKGVGDGMVR